MQWLRSDLRLVGWLATNNDAHGREPSQPTPSFLYLFIHHGFVIATAEACFGIGKGIVVNAAAAI